MAGRAPSYSAAAPDTAGETGQGGLTALAEWLRAGAISLADHRPSQGFLGEPGAPRTMSELPPLKSWTTRVEQGSAGVV